MGKSEHPCPYLSLIKIAGLKNEYKPVLRVSDIKQAQIQFNLACLHQISKHILIPNSLGLNFILNIGLYTLT